MASNQSSSPLVVGLIVVVMIVSMVSVVSLTYAFTHTSAATAVTVTQTEVAVETETSTQTQTRILQVPGNSYATRPSQAPGNRYPTRPSNGQPPTSTIQASEYGLVESNGWMQTQNGCQIQLINMPAGYAGQYVTVYGTITYTNTNVCPTSIIVSTVA
jgi:hypothetical protein